MAPKIEIVPPRLVDVWAFHDMREADAVEVRASGGFTPVEAVLESWEASKFARTVKFNGEVAAMFGVTVHPAGTMLAPVAVAWLLTTKVVDRYPITFYKLSLEWTKRLYDEYGLLINFVDARHGRALEWARRLGFMVQPVIPFGDHGEPFNPIVYGESHV